MNEALQQHDTNLFSAIRKLLDDDNYVVVLTAEEAGALILELPVPLKLAAIKENNND